MARRAGLAERRYEHYARNTHEPDYATLVRICAALDVTPTTYCFRLPWHDRPCRTGGCRASSAPAEC